MKLSLIHIYWDVDYEYVGYDKSWDDMQQMLEDGEIDMVTSPRTCLLYTSWNGFVEMLKYYPLAKPKTYYCLY